jgi:hypothetical protein
MRTVADEVASGDLILYSGRHPLHRQQQDITGCVWSQVGLLLGGSPPLVFESTKLSECTDVRTGTILRGVQVVRLVDRLNSFKGELAVRSLRPSLPGELEAALLAFVEEVHGQPFNDSKWVAVRALRRRNRPGNGSSFFCSELVAEAYQRLGLLLSPPLGPSSNNYIPSDFCSTYEKTLLRMCAGFRLGEERIMTSPDPVLPFGPALVCPLHEVIAPALPYKSVEKCE